MAIKPVQILITAKDKASGVFDLLKKNAVSLGATLLAYFGVKAFLGAVEGAAELEAKLSEVKAIAGGTAQEMGLIRKAAEDAGAATKYTATQSAEALGNLARAGLTVQQSIAALPGVLALAQAGDIGLAESAEITTKALAGFGLEAEKSGLIADVLAKGANASNTSVLGLAQGLSYAAPTAKSLNLPLETTVALLGKFADGGIDASRGGTALNAILSQFLDPASKFRTELAAMGIATNNFEDALHQLAAAGPAGQKAILAVGIEAGPALRSLLNQGIGAFDGLKKTLEAAQGSAEATAATMQDNLAGSMLSLGSAWDTVKNALTTPILPVLKDGVTQLTNALREAVSNGSVGRFGDILAKGFSNALAAAQIFLGQVDFDAIGARVSSAADRVGEAFKTVELYARNTGNAAQLAWGVMSAGANTVLAVVYTVGEAFAGVASNIQSGVALILSGLSKITFGGVSASFKAAADDMRISAEATWAASEALGQKATEALISVADGAQAARDGWDGLTASTEEATAQATASAAAFDQVGQTLQAMGADAQAAGAKTEAALRGISSQATVTEQDVANAFSRMGIQTKAALTQAAENAKRDFEIVKSSGQATADGLREAFRQYAQAAIAANGGIATEAIKIQAAMQGLEIASDSAGKSVVQAMGSAADATRWVDSAARSAAGGFDSMASAAERAAAAARAADKYSTPKGGSITGNTREERLAGQTAVDNSLQFELRDKLRAGTLSKDDLAALKNVVSALRQREQVDRSVDKFNPAGFSLAGTADRREWENVRAQFEQSIAQMSSQGRTVQVQINTPTGRRTVNTDDAGADALIRSLQDASLASGR